VPGPRAGHVPNFRMPRVCPVCGSAVVREKGGIDHRCSGGLFCAAQRKQAILHFAGRAAMDIEGFGAELIDRMVESSRLKTVADFYELKAEVLIGFELRREPFVYKSGSKTEKVVRIQSDLAKKLLDSVERSRSRPLAKVIYGLGIRHVGETTASDLAHFFRTLPELRATNEQTLLLVKDVGVTTAVSIVRFFAEPHNVEVVKVLELALHTPLPPKERQPSVRFSYMLARLALKGVGEVSLKEVVSQFATPRALIAVGESGGLAHDSPVWRVYTALTTSPWAQVLTNLDALGIAVAESQPTGSHGSNPLYGKSVVITGTLEQFSRDRAKELAILAGARVAGSVSRRIDFVVAGPGAGSKLTDARALRIQVLDEQDFVKLLRECGVEP
jgi:DNA ligase (NAD+)